MKPTYEDLVKELNQLVSQAILFRDTGLGRQYLNEQISRAQAIIVKAAT